MLDYTLLIVDTNFLHYLINKRCRSFSTHLLYLVSEEEEEEELVLRTDYSNTKSRQ